MKLTEEERFALCKLFRGKAEFDAAITAKLANAEVLERKKTGVGYFSTIRFPDSLPDTKGRAQWDWNFEHRNLKHGGSFIAFYNSPDLIELEAVAHYGCWPKEFDPCAFIEAR